MEVHFEHKGLGWVVVRQQDALQEPRLGGLPAPQSQECPHPRGPPHCHHRFCSHSIGQNPVTWSCLAQGMLGAVVFILGGTVPTKNGGLGYHRKREEWLLEDS